MKTTFFANKLVGLLLALFSFHIMFFCCAWAADYPTKPIHLVCSSAAGGPSDLTTRIVADFASKELGVPVLVVNKGGPGGAMAASFVVNEKPDGYTFLAGQIGMLTSNFVLFPDLPYKRSDLVPICRWSEVPSLYSTLAGSPWKTLKEFFDMARKNPGKFRSGGASATCSFVWRGLLKQEKLDVTLLEYKGGAESANALLGGHIDIKIDALTPLGPHVEAGKVRLLAFISSKRHKGYPDVPTLGEAGYPIFSKDLFGIGLFAPAGVPKAMMDKVVAPFRKALSQPDVQARMEKADLVPSFMEGKEFADMLDEHYRFFVELDKQRN